MDEKDLEVEFSPKIKTGQKLLQDSHAEKSDKETKEKEQQESNYENRLTNFEPRENKLEKSEHQDDKQKENELEDLLPSVATKSVGPIRGESDPPKDVIEPPDGGYGWVVVVAAVLINTLAVGFVKSGSLYFYEMMQIFPGVSAYRLSMIFMLISTIGPFEAPLTAKMTQRFGGRVICGLGGFITFLAVFSASFATSLIGLTLSLGILVGIGIGMCTVPTILTVSTYFKKRRSLATAFCVCGNAIGGFAIPPLVQYLLMKYTFRGFLLVFSGVLLNIVVLALLLRPLKPKKILKNENPENEELFPQSRFDSNRSIDQSGSCSSFPNNVEQRASVDEDFLKQQLAIYRSASFVGSMSNLEEISPNKSKNMHIMSSRDLTKPNDIEMTENLKECSSAGQLSFPSVAGNKSATHSFAYLKAKANVKIRAETLREEADKFNRQYKPPAERRIILSQPLESEASSRHNSIDEGDVKEESCCTFKNIISLPKSCCASFTNFFDFEVLRSPKLIAMVISSGLFSMGGPHVFLTYLHAHFQSVEEVDYGTATILLSICSISDLVGRLSSGYMADKKIISIPLLYFVTLSLAGISSLALPWLVSFPLLCIALIIYGYGVGVWIALIPTILTNNHGIEKLPACYGFNRMAMGISNSISPQVMGGLADLTGKYMWSYTFAGICLILASIIQLRGTLSNCSFGCSKKEKE